MSSPVTNPIQTSPNALTPGLHISTFPVSSAAASSILELVRSTRGSAEREPVSIPLTAHPGVNQGKDQCMKCGISGHRSYQCGQFSSSAEPVTDWRRTTNGKIYSVKALLGMPPYCKWTMDTVLEDSSNQNINDRNPSATPTPVPTSFTSQPSNDDLTKLNIYSTYFQIGRSATSTPALTLTQMKVHSVLKPPPLPLPRHAVGSVCIGGDAMDRLVKSTQLENHEEDHGDCCHKSE